MKRRTGTIERALALFLLLLMAIGSFALWILVPAAALRVLMPISGSLSVQVALALAGVPLAMALFAAFLLWANRLYLRVTGHLPDEDEFAKRGRGPLEPLLAWSFVLAVLAFAIWLLFLAHGEPPRTVL